MTDISFTQNRELSWLEFNKRVIDEARDKNVPLLERLKFLSIYDTNLEEFFMVRVGSLTDLSHLKKEPVDGKSKMTASQQIDAILDKLVPMYDEKDDIYEDLVYDLAEEGINISKVRDLSDKDKNRCKIYFDSKIEPILSFQIIDRVHPMPRLANLSLSVVFDLEKKKVKSQNTKETIGIIYLPDRIERFIRISESNYVFLEDIIKEFGKEVFEGYKCHNSYVISLTRNADISFDDDDYDVDMDFRSYMKGKLKKRKRLEPVRLEVDKDLSPLDLEFLCKSFTLNKKSIFTSRAPMQLGFIYDFIDSLPEDFQKANSFEEFSPQASAMVNPQRPMIEQILERDLILSYPYESMDPMIRLLEEAAEDPSVDSIKITLYRIAKDSKIAAALIKAAEAGKEVIALMELRARFDENNNILWSSRLEEAGCKIVYGFDHYKCHSKVCLITRYENGEISFISQIATGNYNEKTAKLYTDFSFMTSDMVIGQDCKDLFDNILIGNLEGTYKKLLVAPKSMQVGLYDLIDDQIDKAERGEEAYIRLKMNSISDKVLINRLAKASQAGVKIEMMVRGVTCILPGIEGKTDNIEIYQVVGRFLEHHRIYQFGKTNPKIYISSADFMTRNIRNRMEVAVPIEDSRIKEYILDFTDIMFSDDVKMRKMDRSGFYKKVDNNKNINAQEVLMKKAIEAFENVKNKNQSDNNININKKIDKKLQEKNKKNRSFISNLFSIFKK
ncbi:polyphosphate kinase 1 [uncultured Anaerococcus sp.]|uniref:polyphosphate kinase 1 n=1 Tax=uncultured Anaerococcus sp. TaxID=293428 RepID=UPI00288AFB6D|nr:polyphosphate kinase 1 [uncultured Anaerococcus sp.]